MTQNQIRRYRVRRKRRDTQKKIALSFAVFFAIMLVFTLISRGIYAAGLPQVTTAHPTKGTLNHEVRAIGNVIPGRQLAVSVEAGIRVKEVFVQPGDRAEAGTALFSMDTEHLNTLLGEKELEIKTMELQAATLNHNNQLTSEEKVREMNQANLDGLEEISDAQTRISRAEEDEKQARRELDVHTGKYAECQSEYDKELWEQKRKTLAEVYEQARRELGDARENLEDVMAEITRRQQEVTAPLQTDASYAVSLLELEARRAEYDSIKSYLDNGGIVSMDMQAVITQVSVFPGELTGNGAAVSYGDISQPFYFEVYLDKEQKKYVEQGMEASLNLGIQQNESFKVTVDYLTQAEDGSGGYIAGICLPEGKGTIGQSGTFSLSVQSQPYPLCISMDAVHADSNGRSFVYIMEETDTVLGTELAARKIPVELLDQTDTRAAISSPALDEQSELIVSSTKEFENGDVVRPKE